MLEKILNFEISDVKIERLIDETTALAVFRIITEGQNRHSLPISLVVPLINQHRLYKH